MQLNRIGPVQENRFREIRFLIALFLFDFLFYELGLCRVTKWRESLKRSKICEDPEESAEILKIDGINSYFINFYVFFQLILSIFDKIFTILLFYFILWRIGDSFAEN